MMLFRASMERFSAALAEASEAVRRLSAARSSNSGRGVRMHGLIARAVSASFLDLEGRDRASALLLLELALVRSWLLLAAAGVPARPPARFGGTLSVPPLRPSSATRGFG